MDDENIPKDNKYWTRIFIAALVVILGLPLFLFWSDWKRALGFDEIERGEGGIVIVDSPEVYSRERLINDRFSQTLWLTNQLNSTDEAVFGNQAISDLRHALEISSVSGVTISGGIPAGSVAGGTAKDDFAPVGGAGDNSDSSSGSASSPTAGIRDKDGQDKRELSVTPIEEFRDKLAYREAIRTEIMETMLDDRHDIEGNTLYRLKFDVTVLPENNVDKFVAVEVDLVKRDYCDSADLEQPASKCLNVKAIMNDWIEQTEKDIRFALNQSIYNFQRMNMQEDEFIDFSNFINDRIGEHAVPTRLYSEVTGKGYSFLGMIPDSAPINKVRLRSDLKTIRDGMIGHASVDRGCVNVKMTQHQKSEAYKNGFESLKKEIRSAQADSGKDPAQVQGEIANRIEDRIRTLTAVEQILFNKECLRPTYDFFRYDVNPAQRPRYLRLQESLLIYYLTNYFPASPPEAVINIWFNEIEQFNRLNNELTFLRVEMTGGPWVTEELRKRYQSKDQQFTERVKRIAILEGDLLRNALADFYIDRYTNWHSVDSSAVCGDLIRRKSDGFRDVYLSCILDFQLETCNPDAYHCSIRVALADNGDSLSPDAIFKGLLDKDESYYSYAITPKESAQRLHLHNAEIRQRLLALTLMARFSQGLDSAAIENLTRLVSESSQRIEQIQRKPLVVSFGDGQPVPVGAARDDETGTSFGWVIGPKHFSPPGSSENGLEFVQAPVQKSLSAVISLPGWWTWAEIKINTCWLNPDEIGLANDNVCPHGVEGSDSAGRFDYVIRLPGSTIELPRKFGYRIERRPSINILPGQRYLADFYVKQKNAKLLIEGTDLWRSTVVTIGHQKANEIEVLPNMKGILATFNEIDAPHNRFVEQVQPRQLVEDLEACTQEARVVVWTSEGRTVQNAFVRIFPNENVMAYASANDAGGMPVTGFGPCRGGQEKGQASKAAG